MRQPVETFEHYIERSEQYVAAVHAADDLMWWEQPEKRAATAAQLGLPADTDPIVLRRALWERRNKTA